jgi:hypothetical protein
MVKPTTPPRLFTFVAIEYPAYTRDNSAVIRHKCVNLGERRLIKIGEYYIPGMVNYEAHHLRSLLKHSGTGLRCYSITKAKDDSVGKEWSVTFGVTND